MLPPMRVLSSLLLLSLGCERLSGCDVPVVVDEEEALLEASEEVIFESTKMLGPHRAEIVKSTRYHDDRRPLQEVLQVAWGNDDHFQVRRYRNGELRSETRVLEGVPYTRSGSGRFRRGTDPQIHRVELSQTWTLWDRTIAPFAEQIVYTNSGESVIEGRPVQRYALSLVEPEVPSEQVDVQLAPGSLSGEVVLDEGSATRLSVDLEGVLLEGGDPARPRTIELKITRTEIGVFPALEVPTNPRGGL